MAASIDDGIKFGSDTPRANRRARSGPPWLHEPALTDAIASAISFAMKNRDDKEGNAWLTKIDAARCIEATILPDTGRANAKSRDAMVRSMLLMELVHRAENGKPLLLRIEELYARACRELPKIMRRK